MVKSNRLPFWTLTCEGPKATGDPKLSPKHKVGHFLHTEKPKTTGVPAPKTSFWLGMNHPREEILHEVL